MTGVFNKDKGRRKNFQEANVHTPDHQLCVYIL